MQMSFDFGDFEAYKSQALKTEAPPPVQVMTHKNLLKATMATAVATSELIDLLKKSVIYGQELEYDRMARMAENVIDEANWVYEIALDADFDKREEGTVILDSVDVDFRLLHAALGIHGEAGEVIAALLHHSNGEELDLQNIEEEDGDLAWYSALMDEAIIRLGGASRPLRLAMNLAKLQARFPEKFSLAASQERCVNHERDAMEGARGGN